MTTIQDRAGEISEVDGGTAYRWTFELWTTTADILCTDRTVLERSQTAVCALLDEIELACSRFRADSEVSAIAAHPGRPVRVSRRLADLLTEGERASRYTDGAVRVDVGAMVAGLGYDQHWAGLSATSTAPVTFGGWAPAGFDPITGTYCAATGSVLDFGSVGKAYAACEVARLVVADSDAGVLVNLGGDIDIQGPAPIGGWQIRIESDLGARPTISLREGALATSSTVRRSWVDDGGLIQHHIVDPLTGQNPGAWWVTVTVAAYDAVIANAAATAAIVRGSGAQPFLTERDLSARLVRHDGEITYVGGWPSDPEAPATEVQP